MKQKIMNSTILTNETGRSMVEMLGVLAIVGVLSVGGVYGYGVAMKKHKANELLHQASMLAATVSAQIESLGGDLPETITDFGSTNYGKFSTSVTQTEDKKKFVLTIQDVDSAVCEQLKKGGMVQNVDCNPDAKTATLTYYKNLATNDEEGKNSPTGGVVEITCDESEKETVTYQSGRCCNEEVTKVICPEEEIPTCIKDAGCDCSDESCCDAVGGDWEENISGVSICCASGTATCSGEGNCICIPKEASSNSYRCNYDKCIYCQTGTAICHFNEMAEGECTCVPENHKGACSYSECITCATGEAICSSLNECICVQSNHDWECNLAYCISCETGEAVCSGEYGECVCV